MRRSDTTNATFRQIIYSLTGVFLLLILVSTIQPENWVAQKYGAVTSAAVIVPDIQETAGNTVVKDIFATGGKTSFLVFLHKGKGDSRV